MAARSTSETKRVRYLLGLSSPAEREHIDAEYFEDDDAFQEMLTAEDDLIDAYARGELASEERRRFEKSFARSLHGRDRVQFARAFAGVISAPRPVNASFFKTIQSPRLLRTATIAAVIVFVAAFAWLVIDHRRMTNEIRELRTQSAELSKRAEALQQTSNTDGIGTTELATQLAAIRAQPLRERGTTGIQRQRHVPEVKNDRETISSRKPEQLINRSDATIGNRFVSENITQLPLNVRNVANLLSLQPGTTRGGYVPGERADQTNIALDGVDVDVNEPLNTYYLMPRNASSTEETIRIPSSLSWLRFQIALERPAIHDDYRLTIKTMTGRTVTSDDWTEPFTPNQTIIDSPAISTSDLPSGGYVLLLMGKEPEGSLVKVAECSFKVIKY